MQVDTTKTEFTLGAFHYRCIKEHFSGVQIYEVTSAYNNENDPGCGYSVVEKPSGCLHFEYPRDSLRNHAFSKHQLELAEKLFDILVATPTQFRQGFGRGFVEDMRRPLQKLPNQLLR
jgi:hypothetical protein